VSLLVTSAVNAECYREIFGNLRGRQGGQVGLVGVPLSSGGLRSVRCAVDHLGRLPGSGREHLRIPVRGALSIHFWWRENVRDPAYLAVFSENLVLSSLPAAIAERIRPGQRREPVLAAWGHDAGGAKVLLHRVAGSKEDAETVSAFF